MAVQRGHLAPLRRPFDERARVSTAMANIKSQKKRNITNAKRHERNKSVKAELKTRTKRVDATLGTDDNDEAVRAAVKRIDTAASKGIIHKNAAARKKSRMMKKVNAAG
jgi:small subunit ribosomal protein S20